MTTNPRRDREGMLSAYLQRRQEKEGDWRTCGEELQFRGREIQCRIGPTKEFQRDR